MASQALQQSRKIFAGINWRDFKYAASKESTDLGIQQGASWQAEFGEACDISNIKLNPAGGFSVRKGRVKSGVVDNDIHTFANFEDHTGAEFKIIGAGDKIYVDPGGAVTNYPVAGGTCDVALTHDFADGFAYKAKTVSMSKFLFYTDGQRGNLKFDGVTWTQLGVTGPALAPVVAVNVAVGVLDGYYKYFYQYIALNTPLAYTGESQRSPISLEIHPVTQQADITIVPPTDPQVTAVRLYRLVGTQYLQVGVDLTLAALAAVGWVFTDNVADADLGFPAVRYDQGAPIDESLTAVKFDGVAQFGNRLVGWGSATLWYSLPGFPEKFWNNIAGSDVLTQPIEIDSQNGQAIKDAIFYRNMLVTFTQNKMGTLYDDGGTGLSFLMREWNLGCPYPRTIQIVRGWLFWLSNDGLYKWDGSNPPIHISAKVDYDISGNNRGIYDSLYSFLLSAASVYSEDDQAYWLSLPLYTSNENQRTLVYDLRMEAAGLNPWSVYDFGFVDGFITADRKIYTACSYKVGAINKTDYMQEQQGTQDEGADFTAWYETRHTDFGLSRFDKAGVEIAANCYTTDKTITMSCIFDGGDVIFVMDTESAGDRTDEGLTDEAYTSGAMENSIMENFGMDCVGKTFAFRVEMNNTNFFYSFDATFILKGRARTAA